ncbi:MAG: hypothetical protein HOP02_15735 [Methylococcaceae bacterium]|nr:hypothetical protein [Methylococcaceae bacterium]
MPSHYYSSLATILSALSVFSVVHAETIDRPSAQPLNPPDYPAQNPPEDFELPLVPESKNTQSADQWVLLVQKIILENDTLDLSHLTTPYQGRKVTVAELETLRQSLTQQYIDQGYVNSGAVIAADAY